MAADAYCANALRFLIDKMNILGDRDRRSLFTRDYNQTAIGFVTNDSYCTPVSIKKFCLTRTTGWCMGYAVQIVRHCDIRPTEYTIWVTEPYEGDGGILVNQQALVTCLRWIIDDTNVGKVAFNVSAPEVARYMR
ncbi:hypothetical protein BC628DRAFT_417611 [Trametes gibbosa]|nr:hypothetical protein BC628DRAFT_417611 [Trametes gibbosa]